MQPFSITIQTNLFLVDFNNETYEEIAIALYKEFNKRFKKTKLNDIFDVEVYWRKGCIVEDFVLIFKDEELIKLWNEKKNSFIKTQDYIKIKEELEKLTINLEDVSIKFNGITITIFKCMLSRHTYVPNKINMKLARAVML
ncbi:hypothetical protein [Winogradskyella sp. R77965]|uniref:hypothetical protein n=1 Tax=Winogradskyella sp. R77965 TaxID=3093872 RepID=UPI0037DCB41A